MKESTSKSVEVTFLLTCWTSEQCRNDVEVVVFSNIGTRLELRIKNSNSEVGLIVRSVFLQPEDQNEKISEKFLAEDVGYVLFITATAGTIGMFLGLIMVSLAVMKTRPDLYQLYLGHNGAEDIHHITEDVTVIHGNVNLVELQEYFCLKIFRKIISFLSDPPITVSRTVYIYLCSMYF